MLADPALDDAYEAYLARMKSQRREPHTAEELWEQMRRVREEVADELSHQERFDRLASTYRSRLAKEGKLNQTPNQVLAELRATRDKVADESYPD